MKNERLHELDSMRALAALGVVCWHYTHMVGAAPFEHVLAPFYRNGVLMVDFFFILSGFVLSRAFWTEGRSRALATNIAARIARMYPLHFVTLLIVAVLQYVLVARLGQPAFTYTANSTENFLLNLFLLQSSGLESGYSFNAPSWSISTEMIVNILFLTIIALPRRAAITVACCVGAFSIGAVLEAGLYNGPWTFGVIPNPIVRTAAGFFIGVGIYAVYKRVRPDSAGTSWLWTAFFAVGVLASAAYLATPSLFGKYPDMAVCYLGFPAIILGALGSPLVRRALSIRPLTYLGDISYSIYMVHFPLILGIHVMATIFGWSMPYSSPVYFAGFLAVLVGCASLSYRLIEAPGKRLYIGRRGFQSPGAVMPAQVGTPRDS